MKKIMLGLGLFGIFAGCIGMETVIQIPNHNYLKERLNAVDLEMFHRETGFIDLVAEKSMTPRRFTEILSEKLREYRPTVRSCQPYLHDFHQEYLKKLNELYILELLLEDHPVVIKELEETLQLPRTREKANLIRMPEGRILQHRLDKLTTYSLYLCGFNSLDNKLIEPSALLPMIDRFSRNYDDSYFNTYGYRRLNKSNILKLLLQEHPAEFEKLKETVPARWQECIDW